MDTSTNSVSFVCALAFLIMILAPPVLFLFGTVGGFTAVILMLLSPAAATIGMKAEEKHQAGR